MRRGSAFVAVIALALGRAAAADDSGVYVAAGLGLADTPDNSILTPSGVPVLTGRTDDGDTSWGITTGYRFNRNIAIELGYLDLGEIDTDVVDATGSSDARATVGFSAEGVTLALVGTFTIAEKWEPYLKAGVLLLEHRARVLGQLLRHAFGDRLTNDDEDALYGLGVRYALTQSLQLYLDSTYLMEVGEPDSGRSEVSEYVAGRELAILNRDSEVSTNVDTPRGMRPRAESPQPLGTAIMTWLQRWLALLGPAAAAIVPRPGSDRARTS